MGCYNGIIWNVRRYSNMMNMLYVSETSQFMFFGSGKWWLTSVFGVRYFQTNPLFLEGILWDSSRKYQQWRFIIRGECKTRRFRGGASDQPRSGFVGVQTGAFLGIPWDSNQEMWKCLGMSWEFEAAQQLNWGWGFAAHVFAKMSLVCSNPKIEGEWLVQICF